MVHESYPTLSVTLKLFALAPMSGKIYFLLIVFILL